MFSELVESAVVRKATNKKWGILASAAIQCSAVAVLILLPLVYTQALPIAILRAILVVPLAPAPSAPPAKLPTNHAQRPVSLLERGLREPTRIPPTVQILSEPELPPQTALMGNGGGDEDILRDLPDAPARPTPPPPPSPVAVPLQRVPVGGAIEAAKIILQTQPVYPILAIQGRVQGNVVLRAVITKDGRVGELELVSGPPLLMKAALDAVKQWRYQPTLLDGQPVEVETTITVSFVLGG